jgi:hypothetical protein
MLDKSLCDGISQPAANKLNKSKKLFVEKFEESELIFARMSPPFMVNLSDRINFNFNSLEFRQQCVANDAVSIKKAPGVF